MIFLITMLIATISTMKADDFTVNPDKVHLIERCWSVNTNGGDRKKPSYYEMTINGKFYKGNRSWDVRWDLIKDATDFTGKNVLELGCNMAVLSTCLKKYRGVNKAVGVEAPDWLLRKLKSPDRLNAAKWFAQAFEVEVNFIQVNLHDEPGYEDTIGYDYDIVFCMSLMHWIKDKERLLRYLSNFNELIYEGHESLEIELDRLNRHGFYNYRILGYGGRGAILHVTK